MGFGPTLAGCMFGHICLVEVRVRVSAAIALAVALVTVGTLAARAAVANPADALRYE